MSYYFFLCRFGSFPACERMQVSNVQWENQRVLHVTSVSRPIWRNRSRVKERESIDSLSRKVNRILAF